jgi:hypothetical protein
MFNKKMLENMKDGDLLFHLKDEINHCGHNGIKKTLGGKFICCNDKFIFLRQNRKAEGGGWVKHLLLLNLDQVAAVEVLFDEIDR